MGRAIGIWVMAAAAVLPLCSMAADGAQNEAIVAAAKTFVGQLANEEFEAATATFDATMTGAMPEDKLREIWGGLIGQVGRFQKQTGTRTQKIQQYDIVFVTCEFEMTSLDIKVVFDPSQKIAGLFFLPVQKDYDFTPPAYAKPQSFSEREVKVGSDPWTLPGTLTLPRGGGPVAALVLVHGSGPQDRDETIGPNKPFRDLAWGLASRGIAVLRYEKRTKQHASAMLEIKDEVTVEEETVDDALKAVTLLRNTPEIDHDRVFVLGHSLGGMLAPRIGKRDNRIAGLVIMAGTTRPLEDVIVEQFDYLAGVDGEVTDDEKSRLAEIREQAYRVRSPDLSPDTPADRLPLGMPARYWLDLRGYDPAQTAADLTMPILIVHGGRDYQVTMTDYVRWQGALGSHENVCFKLFPTLNHLFMRGEGPSQPSEYEEPGHVDESVIETIDQWIRNGCGG